jgi:hypothetical protein
MSKYFFIGNDTLTKLLLLVIALWLFSFQTILGFVIVVSLPLLFIFRRKNINLLEKRVVEDNIVLSPISGQFIGEINKNGKLQLLINIKPWRGFGVYFPLKGDIDHYYEDTKTYKLLGIINLKRTKVQTLIKSKGNQDIKLKFKSNLNLNKAAIHVRSGDRGISGALLGYLPFGGKVVIELPMDSKVLVKSGDRVSSTQTLLASFKDKNELIE